MKSWIARLINLSKYREFEEGVREPEKAYERLEQEILSLLEKGSFWPARLQNRKRIADFDFTDYETYRSILANAILHETHSPLTGDPIDFWCTSSGSSAEPKLFPLSESYRQQLLRISGSMAYFIAKKMGRNMQHPFIFFSATGTGRKTDLGVDIGFISRYMFLKQPALIRKSYAIPQDIFSSGDLLTEWGPLYGMAKDISGIFATVPVTIASFCESIEARKEELFDILVGRKSWPKGIPPYKVSQDRLRQIEKALQNSPFVMKELWPHMSVLMAWKGSTAGLLIPRLEKYSRGEVFFSDAIYSATEGWLTVPMLDHENLGHPMHMGATYAEFLPENETLDKSKLLKPWELQPGKKYEIFLSQAMGFVRYRLFDVVECKGFYHRSPILEFLYKAENIVRLGVARFSEVNILQAIREAQFEYFKEWTIAPAADGSGMIFYSTELQPDLAAKVQKLDSVLANINKDVLYDYDHGLLKRMQVRRLEHNHPFWLAGRHGQGKNRVLSKKPLE